MDGSNIRIHYPTVNTPPASCFREANYHLTQKNSPPILPNHGCPQTVVATEEQPVRYIRPQAETIGKTTEPGTYPAFGRGSYIWPAAGKKFANRGMYS